LHETAAKISRSAEQEGPKATEGGHFGHRGSLRNFLPGDSKEIGPGFIKYSG
jgi:hypothetical protein